jgi:hypothetical protein
VDEHLSSVRLTIVFIKKTLLDFRFPNLEILMLIIINTFTFELIEVTREKNSTLPTCLHYIRLLADVYYRVSIIEGTISERRGTR